MSDTLKDRLIRLGSQKPELREHIRPVLDRISESKVASKDRFLRSLRDDKVENIKDRLSMSMDDEQFYLTGGCQYFALALWNVSDIREIGVLFDRSDQTVAHVVGVNFSTGYDVLGERSLSEITSHYDDLIDPDWDMVSASQLKSEYMGSGKPLWNYDQQEIEDAEELILREQDKLFPSLKITRNP